MTPVLFAILPALQSTRADAGDALKDGGARTAGAARATRSRSVLIVAQLSLAVMLLVLATLLVQALVNIADAPLGLDARKMLTARIELPAWRYGTPAAIGDYHVQLLDRLRANPAIRSAALVDRQPLLDGEPASSVSIGGRAAGARGGSSLGRDVRGERRVTSRRWGCRSQPGACSQRRTVRIGRASPL